jgi:DNA replicative helicase MCM subunit Mcm2 (Cdc46/Mcm family)
MIPLYGEYNFVCENCGGRAEIQINPLTGIIKLSKCKCQKPKQEKKE